MRAARATGSLHPMAAKGATLRFYTRPGCTLCEKAWPVAQELARRHGLELRPVDVGGDPELEARYGERIPVLVLGERELGRGLLSARALEREFSRARATGDCSCTSSSA